MTRKERKGLAKEALAGLSTQFKLTHTPGQCHAAARVIVDRTLKELRHASQK